MQIKKTYKYLFTKNKIPTMNLNKLNTTVTSLYSITNRYLNNNVASISKIHREVYTRMYPTIVVLPDGSSINVRYHEPRKIIKLPLDLSQLSEEERRLRIEKRKPKKKVVIVEDIEDNYNAKKYLKYMKKK